jgi:hypothetical protein
MAARHCSVDNQERLRNLIESVLESDYECSDSSEDETGCEQSSGESDDVSGVESDMKDDDIPGPSTRVRTTVQKKQFEWKWTKTANNPVIYPFTENSGICNDLSKFEAEPPSELSVFSEYMDHLFEKICDETNLYARVHLNNPNRKKLKDDEKWFDTTEDEIKTYLALVILMSQVRKPRIQLY